MKIYLNIEIRSLGHTIQGYARNGERAKHTNAKAGTEMDRHSYAQGLKITC